MDKLILTNEQCQVAAMKLRRHFGLVIPKSVLKIYGVPRGGIPVAYLVRTALDGVADHPNYADLIVDDIVDSGATRDRFNKEYPDTPFSALCDFIYNPDKRWVVFPWEREDRGGDKSADDIAIRLLQYIGENPNREGLKETPQRFLKAWKEWSNGYGQDPAQVLKTFQDGGEKYDEMVVVKDLPFFSHCEHHLTPFFGTATIAYVPDKKVVGLSKLGRVLKIFSQRLQIQERLTTQIADSLNQHLAPKGVGVLIKARHLCMESRGMATQGHFTITSALRGVFLDDGKARQEFLSIA